MNLQTLLAARVEAGKPVRAGLIGAGKFGSMFLAQVPSIKGLEVALIADRDVERAKAACKTVGWDAARIARTRFADNGRAACDDERVDVVIEATGDPGAGIAHALAAIEAQKTHHHGQCRGRRAGRRLSRAQGARGRRDLFHGLWRPAGLDFGNGRLGALDGFMVAAAGKGTKYLPAYHTVTPDGVWQHYGLSAAEAKEAGMNSQMFNSFLDGTKSAIEMAAVANACDLDVPQDGLIFRHAAPTSWPACCGRRRIGGVLEADGMVEVVSSLKRDGSPVERDLRWGVYVVLKAQNDYAAACFKQYGLPTDATGRYAAMYKPFHLIGLELSISVLNVALRGEPTGSCRGFRGDAVAVAKRALKAGETLDGEGGYTRLCQADAGGAQPQARRVADRAGPSRQAQARYRRRRNSWPQPTSRSTTSSQAVRMRREMEPAQARQASNILAGLNSASVSAHYGAHRSVTARVAGRMPASKPGAACHDGLRSLFAISSTRSSATPSRITRGNG